MAKEYIKAIASAVLPTQILDYFLVVGVEQTATEIYSSLDELPDKELTDDIHFKSKGFMEPVHVTEFRRNRQTLWGGCTDANPKLLLNDT